MNQCNAEISFNKFAYGKSEKGGGLYLQGVGKFFFVCFSFSFSFLFLKEKKLGKKNSYFSLPSDAPLQKKKLFLQSETSRAASSRTTPPPSAAASSAAPPRATSSTRPSRATAPSRSAEASTTRTSRATSRGASSPGTRRRAARLCSGPSPRGTRGITRGWTTRRRLLTTLPFRFFSFFLFLFSLLKEKRERELRGGGRKLKKNTLPNNNCLNSKTKKTAEPLFPLFDVAFSFLYISCWSIFF